MISIIVALDDKQGIGAKNRLLWHLKKDFAHFKTLTLGHPVIMGRKTYQSIGKPLPGRANIIVTRDSNFSAPGCLIAISLESAIACAKDIDGQEVFIIGGGQIYQEAMAKNLVDKLYVTKVQGDFQADTFFPDYSHFKLLKQEENEEGNYHFEFLELERSL
jgi:dihydrofolate reductase